MDVACLRWLAVLLVVLVALPAQAANYVFPGALPASCSGVGPSYTCTSLTLAWGDTITIVPKPATITINGNLDTNNAQINLGGTSADLNIMVSGTLILKLSGKNQCECGCRDHQQYRNGGDLRGIGDCHERQCDPGLQNVCGGLGRKHGRRGDHCQREVRSPDQSVAPVVVCRLVRKRR